MNCCGSVLSLALIPHVLFAHPPIAVRTQLLILLLPCSLLRISPLACIPKAIACLKRALYLDPFEWIISYNLGLVHLNTGQYASAFHYFSASINLKPDFPSSYMYLAITLSRLDDFDNACNAYEKAIEMER